MRVWRYRGTIPLDWLLGVAYVMLKHGMSLGALIVRRQPEPTPIVEETKPNV